MAFNTLATVDQVARVLMQYRFAFANEKQLQDGIERILTAENFTFEREFRLTAKDRPDFFLPDGGVVVEIKIKGATNDVLRQLYRYAEHEQVKAIVLVTSVRTAPACPHPEARRSLRHSRHGRAAAACNHQQLP